jgi:hypothetical protein
MQGSIFISKLLTLAFPLVLTAALAAPLAFAEPGPGGRDSKTLIPEEDDFSETLLHRE